MIKEVTRYIKKEVERELWARAAGRCQFKGCNRILYRSPVTQEPVNISEKGHIYSFSKDGPRGWGIFKTKPKGLNDIDNLMLVCHDCHRTIDQQSDGGRYQAELLIRWKAEHEKRVAIVTGVDPTRRSYVVMYGAKIGDETSFPESALANWALFPDWYPADEKPIRLNMTWEGKDHQPNYWVMEEQNLSQKFDRLVRPLIEEGHHFSIFGFAPIPSLIRLGTLFTDKIPSEVYQLQREPKQTWEWSDLPKETDFMVNMPANYNHQPALLISLSAKISHDRIISVLGSNVSIWELTIAEPDNDFLKTRDQLSNFRKTVRKLMVQISEKHGKNTPLAIFPAMPVATAVDFGRVRMPKAEMPWIIYDQNNRVNAFIKALQIGGTENGQ
jgi:hypothetical protein